MWTAHSGPLDPSLRPFGHLFWGSFGALLLGPWALWAPPLGPLGPSPWAFGPFMPFPLGPLDSSAALPLGRWAFWALPCWAPCNFSGFLTGFLTCLASAVMGMELETLCPFSSDRSNERTPRRQNVFCYRFLGREKTNHTHGKNVAKMRFPRITFLGTVVVVIVLTFGPLGPLAHWALRPLRPFGPLGPLERLKHASKSSKNLVLPEKSSQVKL
jgi:hypothetical protein